MKNLKKYLFLFVFISYVITVVSTPIHLEFSEGKEFVDMDISANGVTVSAILMNVHTEKCMQYTWDSSTGELLKRVDTTDKQISHSCSIPALDYFKDELGVWTLRTDCFVCKRIPVDEECMSITCLACTRLPIIAITQHVYGGNISAVKFERRPSSEVVSPEMRKVYAHFDVEIKEGSVVQYPDTFAFDERLRRYIRIWNWEIDEYADIVITDNPLTQMRCLLSFDGRFLAVSLNNDGITIYRVEDYVSIR